MAKTTSRLPLNRRSAEAVVDGQANKLNAKAGEHGRTTQGRAVDEPQPSDVVLKLSVEDLNPRHIDAALDAVGSAVSVNEPEADPSVDSEATTPPTSSDGSGLGQHYRIVEDRNDVIGVSSAPTVLAPNDKLVMYADGIERQIPVYVALQVL